MYTKPNLYTNVYKASSHSRATHFSLINCAHLLSLFFLLQKLLVRGCRKTKITQTRQQLILAYLVQSVKHDNTKDRMHINF